AVRPAPALRSAVQARAAPPRAGRDLGLPPGRLRPGPRAAGGRRRARAPPRSWPAFWARVGGGCAGAGGGGRPAADQAPPDVPPFKINRGDFGEGLEVALLVSHELGIEDDEAALARLYDIGSKIALAADDPSTVTTFYVVKISEPHAFAAPGGVLFV